MPDDRDVYFVGCAAGGSGDRVDAAAPIVATLIERGRPAALIFENLAERTLAFAQLAKRANPDKGYEPLLEEELRPVLEDCLRHGIAIVSNFGAANPRGAAANILRLSESLGLPRPRVAVVEGDDLSTPEGEALVRPLLPGEHAGRRFVSANVYQGAREIAGALKSGAQIVVTGRVADSSRSSCRRRLSFPRSRAKMVNQTRARVRVGNLVSLG